jgi:hypothetical protein
VGTLSDVTTTTSSDPHVYGSRGRFRRNGRSTAAAAAIAWFLAGLGTVAMIVGIGGSLGFFSIDRGRTVLVMGLGLVALGSGLLLLVVYQTWRIVTDR